MSSVTHASPTSPKWMIVLRLTAVSVVLSLLATALATITRRARGRRRRLAA